MDKMLIIYALLGSGTVFSCLTAWLIWRTTTGRGPRKE